MEAAMRSEEEMMHLILQVAKDDERVRAVYLNGSRTNHNAPKDRFQDYDVVYVVTDTKPFMKIMIGSIILELFFICKCQNTWICC